MSVKFSSLQSFISSSTKAEKLNFSNSCPIGDVTNLLSGSKQSEIPVIVFPAPYLSVKKATTSTPYETITGFLWMCERRIFWMPAGTNYQHEGTGGICRVQPQEVRQHSLSGAAQENPKHFQRRSFRYVADRRKDETITKAFQTQLIRLLIGAERPPVAQLDQSIIFSIL